MESIGSQIATDGEYERPLIHILAVPFQSEGHIVALLRLAQTLIAIDSQKGLFVTFAYPARSHNLARLRNELPPALLSSTSLRIEVVDDGLPLEAEQPVTFKHKVSSFVVYREAVKGLLDDLLRKSKPSSVAPSPSPCCIISDTMNLWMQDFADAVGLPRIDFWPMSATVYSQGCHLSALISNGTLPLPKSIWVDAEKWTAKGAPLIEGVPGMLPFPAVELLDDFVHAEKVSDYSLQFMINAFELAKKAQTILVHSVYELESQVLDALGAVGFPIIGIGTLPDYDLQPSQSMDADAHESIQWLDMQPPASVVYIALGSVAKFTAAQRNALALGLEASGFRFLWVIRQDTISGTLSEALPQGFLQRTVEKGLGFLASWVPQAQVLCHQSVCAFFSHCGWNSTMESLWDGVPVVACPRVSEQRCNARRITDKWKTGVELERQDDGSFSKEAVEKALKQVLAAAPEGKGGPSYKENAAAWRKVIRSAMQKGGSAHTNLANFLQGLRHSVR